MINDEYECAVCHGIFGFVRTEDWNEDKAKQEYERLFYPLKWNDQPKEIVCDDCWKLAKPDER